MAAHWILAGMAATFILLFSLRMPLPVVFIGTSIVGALLGGFGIAPLHLVEGLFGYIYPMLILCSGAIFNRWMRESGVADAIAGTIFRWFQNRPLFVLATASSLVYVVGMFTGVAAAAVLFAGAVAVPVYLRLGMERSQAAALLAVVSILGMVGPPVNLPAAMVADGVNMPYSEFSWILLVLSLPLAIFSTLYIGRYPSRAGNKQQEAPQRALSGAEDVAAAAGEIQPPPPPTGSASLWPLAAAIVPLLIWMAVRTFPHRFTDPSLPIVFLAGSIVTLLVRRKPFNPIKTAYDELSGTVLHLGAVLAAVGMLVQILTLTGVRGWVIVNTMTLKPPLTYLAILIAMPLIGGILTSLGSASMLGVPFAFIFIDRDMVVNASALSLMGGLAEMMPPTAIAAILSGYLAGDMRLKPIWRHAAVPLAAMAVVSIIALVYSTPLGNWLR